MRFNCVVSTSPLGPYNRLPSLHHHLTELKNSRWLMEFEPTTFQPAFWSANHYQIRTVLCKEGRKQEHPDWGQMAWEQKNETLHGWWIRMMADTVEAYFALRLLRLKTMLAVLMSQCYQVLEVQYLSVVKEQYRAKEFHVTDRIHTCWSAFQSVSTVQLWLVGLGTSVSAEHYIEKV